MGSFCCATFREFAVQPGQPVVTTPVRALVQTGNLQPRADPASGVTPARSAAFERSSVGLTAEVGAGGTPPAGSARPNHVLTHVVTFVRRGSPDPAVRPTVGLQVTRQRSETAVAEGGWVRRPWPNQPGSASSRSPRWDNPIPCLVPHTGNRATVIRGLVSTHRGSEMLGMIARFWPGACATRLQPAAPFGSWLQGPGVNLQRDHGHKAGEDVLRDE